MEAGGGKRATGRSEAHGGNGLYGVPGFAGESSAVAVSNRGKRAC
ncbi:MAG TPA: hypothetical protein VFJ06_04200 [Halococcus sp.]|nr:hypothetical protein [Halococcus sp.]